MEETFFSSHINSANPEEQLKTDDIQLIQDQVDEEIKNSMQFNFIRNETDFELKDMNTDPLKKKTKEVEPVDTEVDIDCDTPDGASSNTSSSIAS